MLSRKTSLWLLAAAALAFVGFVLTVIDLGNFAIRAILDPAHADANDWKNVVWIFLLAVTCICSGLAGYLGLRKSSVK